MRKAKVSLAALLAALVPAVCAAQTAEPGEGRRNRPPSVSLAAAPCPTVTVGTRDLPNPGKTMTYTASVNGGDPGVKPTFDWTVSAGTITSGQGTGSVTVNVSGTDGTGLTAAVDVGGYDRACPTSASVTLIICPGPARKLDEYGAISLADEKARLDNFAAELRNDPTAQGYLVCYGGRRGRAGEAARRCGRAMRYTGTHFRGIEAPRLVTVEAGYREAPAVELWVVPSGAAPPPLSPTVFPREVSPPEPRRSAAARP
ncbi:MAG TPA: hypothetical protein VF659_06610 [Pyrinomonadaceae bacterium]|jgi:hypothetical protein